jgi:hypothetical protein
MSFWDKITNALSDTRVLVGSVVGIAAIYMYIFKHLVPTKHSHRSLKVRLNCHLNSDSAMKYKI